jgi:F-type H+-transporting ATPase subunit delta
MRRFARPYAQATMTVAGSVDEAGAVRDQLAAFAQAMTTSPELRGALANPALPVETKQAIAGKIAERLGMGPLASRLLRALVQRQRTGRLAEVIDALTLEINRQQGVAVAEVATAEPLGDDERAALQRVLEKKVGKKLQLTTRVEPELLAGFVAQVDSELFDGSLRGQLERLARDLAGA